MKQILLYVAAMLGSLIAQAQPAVEFHDVTAAITDSVRIVPNFSLGDTRTYLATFTNHYNDQFDESNSAEYRFTVESVDQDHYGIFFYLDKMQYEMPENIPTTQAKMLLDMFQDKGFRFSINRKDLTVDSIFYNEFLDPFKVYLTTAFREMFANKMEPEQMEREIEEGLNGDFLKRTVTELMQAVISPFTEPYGRTLPLGDGQWIEDVVDEDPIIVDDIELPEDSVESFDDWETLPDVAEETEPDSTSEEIDADLLTEFSAAMEQAAPDAQGDEEADDSEVVSCVTDELNNDEELPDSYLQKNHYTTTTRGEDGSIQYTETVIWNMSSTDDEPVWQERYSATLDAQGWPIEITRHIVMMGLTQDVHWQLIQENE